MNVPQQIVDLRSEMLLAQALMLAIEALRHLPDQHRPDSNVAEMIEMLVGLSDVAREAAEPDVRRWLSIAAWNIRSKPVQ